MPDDGTGSDMNQERDVLFGRVAIIGVVMAVLAIAAKVALMVAKSSVMRMVLPLRALYTKDHAITEKGMAFLSKALDVAMWMVFAAACLIIVYAVIGRFVSRRLPPHGALFVQDQHPRSAREIGGIVAILVGGLGLRMLQMNQGLSYDEMFTACNFVDTDSYWKTISTYVVFNNHIAYSIVARFAQLTLGRTEWVLRLPALLFGLLAILAVWSYGRRLGGASRGLWAAAFLALFPLHIVYSELARGYTGMALFVFLSSMFYIRVLEQGRKKDAALYSLASVLAVYFHLYAILVVGVQIAFVLGLTVGQLRGVKAFNINRQAFRIVWFAFFVVMICCVICYLPVVTSLAVNIQNRGRSSFQPSFPWQVVDDLSGNPGVMMVIGMAIVALLGLKSLWKRHCQLAAYCLAILILPMGAVMVARPSDLYTRFFIYFLPWYALLLSFGVEVMGQKVASLSRPLGLAARSALIGIFAVLMWPWLSAVSWNYASGPFGGYIAPYRAVGQAMLAQTGSNVCFCAFGEGCEELSYYAGRKLRILQDVNEVKSCLEQFDELRCAYNVTIWDTPSQKKMAKYLGENGRIQRFAESRPCQEVVLFTISGKGRVEPK